MAYDAATTKAVLFGGEDSSGQLLGDTWTWNGTNWRQQAPATSPPARSGGSMVYNAASRAAVLFGGCCDSNFNLFADTWTWG
jgi:Galactose oxidase, central domain